MTHLLLLLYTLFLRPTEPQQVVKIREEAISGQKHIAVYFSGSDWCKYCHLFKSETLTLPEVDSILSNQYIFYTADFPQHKKLDKATAAANDYLAEKLNPQGMFPLLVIADSDFRIKAQISKKNNRSEVIEVLTASQKK